MSGQRKPGRQEEGMMSRSNRRQRRIAVGFRQARPRPRRGSEPVRARWRPEDNSDTLGGRSRYRPETDPEQDESDSE